MSARDNILKTISLNKPALVAVPDINVVTNKSLPVDEAFEVAVKNAASAFTRAGSIIDVKKILDEANVNRRVIDLVFEPAAAQAIKTQNAHDLESLYVTYLKGTLGVAENAAIWLQEPDIVNRLAPFICEHLVIVLNIQDLVYTMHEAYDKIRPDQYGYGVFIGGPSKTADIEQALVIGAHGPRSLHVFLVG